MINSAKLSFKEKVGYSSGDLASRFVWDMVNFWMVFFYTDIFGISPLIAGAIVAAGSIWDAVVDPIVGIVSDRTNTRWGKFRPYLLFGSVPLAIILVLAFTTPAFSPTGMIVYAAITALLLRTAYAFVNLPYSSLSAVMTSDTVERTGLNTYRFIAANIGQFIVSGAALFLLAYFGIWGNSEKIEKLSQEIVIVSQERNIAQGDSIIKLSEEMIENISQGGKILSSAQEIVKLVQVPNLELAQEIGNISNRVNLPQKDSIAKLAEELIESISRVKEIEKPAQEIIKLAQGINPAQGDSIINLVEKIILNTSQGGEAAKKAQEIGNTIQTQGAQYTVILFAILSIIFFYITFRTTKERIQPPKGQELSVKKDFKYLFKNRPWIVLTIVSLVSFIMFAMQNSATVFYFKYYIGAAESVQLFNVLGTIAIIVALPMSKPLAKRFGNKNVFIASSIISGIFFTLIFTAGNNLILVNTFNILAKIAYAPAIPLIWTMIADAADFGEWKLKHRTVGLCFSAAVFAQKVGWAIGASAGTWVLAASNYVANAPVQTPEAIMGMKLLVSVIPGVLYASCAIFMAFYNLDAKTSKLMEQELSAKRAAEM